MHALIVRCWLKSAQVRCLAHYTMYALLHFEVYHPLYWNLVCSIPTEFAANLPETLEIFSVGKNKMTGIIPAFPNYKKGSVYDFILNRYSGSKLQCSCANL